MKRRALFMSFLALWALPSLAAETTDNATRLEVDRELRHQAKLPPPSLELRFDGIDSTRYELVDAQFTLDAKPIPHQLKPGMMAPGSTVLFFGIVSPGAHTFIARLVFKPVKSGSIFSYVDDVKFKIPGKVTALAQRGLVLSVRAHVKVNERTPDLYKRLEFAAEVTPRIVANLEEPAAVARAAEPPPAPATALVPAPTAPVEAPPARLAERTAPAISVPPEQTIAKLRDEPVPLPRPRPVRHRKVQSVSSAPASGEEQVEPDVSSRALKSLLQRARQAARASSADE